MTIAATILRVSQELDLASKEQVNFIIFCLSNGKEYKALIADDTAQAIIQAAMGNLPQTSTLAVVEPHTSPQFSPGVASDGSPAVVFGGEQRQAPTATPGVRPRFVGADDYGNPIVEYPGGVDPSSVTGTVGSRDEDGVSQL